MNRQIMVCKSCSDNKIECDPSHPDKTLLRFRYIGSAKDRIKGLNDALSALKGIVNYVEKDK